MFEGLTHRFIGLFDRFRKNTLTEHNLAETLTEVRMALLSADVHFKTAKQFVDSVKEKCLGIKKIADVSAGDQFVKILYDEIVALLTSENQDLCAEKPLRILMVGLHGSGKTTSSVKLALLLRKSGYQPAVVACDVYRPAAIDQLEILAKKQNIPFFCKRDTKNVCAIAKESLAWADEGKCDAVIFDTAGRLQIDQALLEELQQLKTVVQPQEVLLVTDSALGQEAVNVAKTFHEQVALTGILLTKLDGDSRGGAALSMKNATGVPIKFIGIGEKPEDFQMFHPDRVAKRILGMGDIVSLVENAMERIEDDEALLLKKRLASKDFNLEDFLTQIQQMKKMGSLSSISKLLPGIPSIDNEGKHDAKMQRLEAAILSMTRAERLNPNLIEGSRRDRIARGSGLPIREVNQALKQFQQMRQFMRLMKQPKGKKMFGQFSDALDGKNQKFPKFF